MSDSTIAEAPKSREQLLIERALGEGATAADARVLQATRFMSSKRSPSLPKQRTTSPRMPDLPPRRKASPLTSSTSRSLVRSTSPVGNGLRSPSSGSGLSFDLRNRSVSPLSRFTPEVPRASQLLTPTAFHSTKRMSPDLRLACRR